jgi:hypothetical protein
MQASSFDLVGHFQDEFQASTLVAVLQDEGD